jgi:hypothetical protein
MKSLEGRLIIVCLLISFSFSTSCSDGLYEGSLDTSDILAQSAFLEDPEAVYISINQVVNQNEPEIAGVNVFDASDVNDSPVEINLDNPGHRVIDLSMYICDEEDYLSLMRCEITERTAGYMCRAGESNNGCCSVMLFSTTGDVIEEGTGPIFTLQYVVADGAPSGECRTLTTENVEATDSNGDLLQVISSQGEYCFAGEAVPGDSDGDGILDDDDNCPDKENPMQEDLDSDGEGDICDPDIDNDAYLNEEDACPRSNPEDNIIIDDCTTDVKNENFDAGCKMSDLIDQCAESAKKQTIFIHGRFVSCVAGLTNEWKKDGLIGKKDKGAIQRCTARSKLPWVRLNWD